mgnify:CR=1 FL=1
MCLVSKNGITDVIVMRNLYFVEQDHIFQLGGVADNGSFTYDRIAADECTVAYFCFFSDDRRSVNVSGRCYGCGFCDPDVFPTFFVFFFA